MPKKLSYSVDQETGCWSWTGKIWSNGYVDHKYYYEKYMGKVAKGMALDHLCRNKICVNPVHLEVVTPQENIHRSAVTKLNWGKVENIKSLYIDGVRQKEIGRRFNINQSQVSRIVNGLRWQKASA